MSDSASLFLWNKMKYTLLETQQLADLVTPVGLYLRLREQYAQVLLLENSDYSLRENSSSFLCFGVQESLVMPKSAMPSSSSELSERIAAFVDQIEVVGGKSASDAVYGFTGFETAACFEGYVLNDRKEGLDMPALRYDFYRFVIEIDHYRNLLVLREYTPEGETSQLDQVLRLIRRQDIGQFRFTLDGAESSPTTDQDFLDFVKKAKEHCQRGDVFQLVLSRRFTQGFSGDEFNVYRALRSVNPSPYLFYFDYGSYKIFGSSPEAHLVISDGKAEIHPIAGTFRRDGDPDVDRQRADKLLADPKENSEHVMLVDLARNDLSKHGNQVTVDKYKEVQYFSHVIHLVSKVTAKLRKDSRVFDVFGGTFPAGTLSGAPKYRALELIEKYEKHHRDFYGGAIGMIHLNGDLNHAIIIRSILSQAGTLHYQAGAGIVIDSIPESELQEVENKLAALKTAIQSAEGI